MLVELVSVYLHSEVLRNLNKRISAHHPHFRCPSICTEDLWQLKIGVDSEIGSVIRPSNITKEDRRPVCDINDYDLLIVLLFDVSYCQPEAMDTEV